MTLKIKGDQTVSISIRHYGHKVKEYIESFDKEALAYMGEVPETTITTESRVYVDTIFSYSDEVKAGNMDINEAKRNLQLQHAINADVLNAVIKEMYEPQLPKMSNKFMAEKLRRKLVLFNARYIDSFSPVPFIQESNDRRQEKIDELTDLNAVSLSKLANIMRIEDWKENILIGRVLDRYEHTFRSTLDYNEEGLNEENVIISHTQALEYAFFDERDILASEVALEVDNFFENSTEKRWLLSVIRGNESPINKTMKRLRNRIKKGAKEIVVDIAGSHFAESLDYELPEV